MRKKTWILLAAVAILALWAAEQSSPREKVTTRFLADREQLEEIAIRVLDGEEPAGLTLPDGWKSVRLYHNGPDTVEFFFEGSGLGSSTTYWGMNYVPSGVAVGFQGSQWDYWKAQGNGRLYYEPEGDNSCYVEQLDTYWYYYEARF